MNKNEMLAYLKDLQNQVAYVSFFANQNAYDINARYHELLNGKGYTRYISTGASEEEVANYLECYINAIHDSGFADRIKF